MTSGDSTGVILGPMHFYCHPYRTARCYGVARESPPGPCCTRDLLMSSGRCRRPIRQNLQPAQAIFAQWAGNIHVDGVDPCQSFLVED
ncbi:hypothetical protein Q31a_30640 [Aureliella helgolandensis]|uniref:Uncharacterized protein n=1 Tax=Aureliella helgolandensis TaxID=2527968 RepID=A0A518G836_9BACT|nr:hypothetical protein Q31a_30640 [Aureliella helgolandensis]